MTDHFVKVFDVVDSGFTDWTFAAHGIIPIVIAIVLLVHPKITNGKRLLLYVSISFAVLWTIAVVVSDLSTYLRFKAMAQNHSCRVVEGPIEHFVPMPYTGHQLEAFSVSGVPFSYSDFIRTGGFNNTSSHGGPISSDSYVRICYAPGHVILRLEIRDVKARPEDRGRPQSILPKPADVPDVYDIPWACWHTTNIDGCSKPP
jgi:hypothetical protein